MFNKVVKTVATYAVATSLLSTVAHAETLKYAHGNPPAAPSVKASEAYVERVKQYSDGELNVRVFPQSLLKNEEISAGLNDGVADIGLLLPSYFPSEYPNFSMVADLSMMATSTGGSYVTGIYAFVGALMDYTFFNCPSCLDDFQKRNQVYMGGFAATPFILTCTKPVTSLADIKGMNVRSVGASLSRWTEYVGANPISMPGTEFLQALSQGVVGCVETNVVDAINWGLAEVSTDITLNVPGGMFAQVAGMNVNTKVWERLSPKNRTALMRGSAAQAAGTVGIYLSQNEDGLKTLREGGKVNFHEVTGDLWDKTQEFIELDQKTIVDYYQTNFGVKDGAQAVESFKGLFTKWLGIMEGVEAAEKAEEIYWNELYSKLDPEKFGL